MSVPYQWPIAFMKQWIQPIAYIVGLDYNYNIVPVADKIMNFDALNGVIKFGASFSSPIILAYAFSYVAGYATEPITIFLDYPARSLFVQINISP